MLSQKIKISIWSAACQLAFFVSIFPVTAAGNSSPEIIVSHATLLDEKINFSTFLDALAVDEILRLQSPEQKNFDFRKYFERQEEIADYLADSVDAAGCRMGEVLIDSQQSDLQIADFGLRVDYSFSCSAGSSDFSFRSDLLTQFFPKLAHRVRISSANPIEDFGEIILTESDRELRYTGGSVSPKDSDLDILPDAIERLHGTDPERFDTDGDGYSDRLEIFHEWDPLSAEPGVGQEVLPPTTKDSKSWIFWLPGGLIVLAVLGFLTRKFFKI